MSTTDGQETLPLQFEFAWKWFDFHAKQRMQLFNFFLIITGILVNAYVRSYEDGSYGIGLVVCLLGALQTVGFFVFDVRSRSLTAYAEDILEKLERDHLYPDGFKHKDVQRGRQLGILRREAKLGLREGSTFGQGLVSRLRKMKTWIRLLQVAIGIFFLLGGIHAGWELYDG